MPYFGDNIGGPSNGFTNGMGNTSNNSGANNPFPTIGEFEIGTFIAPTGESSGSGASNFKTENFRAQENNGSQLGVGCRNIFGQSASWPNQSGRPISGPGIRETGIIEKLLVS